MFPQLAPSRSAEPVLCVSLQPSIRAALTVGAPLYNTGGDWCAPPGPPDRQAQNQRCPACRTVGTCAHGSLPTDWMAICDAIEEDMGCAHWSAHRSSDRRRRVSTGLLSAAGRRSWRQMIGAGKHIMPLAAVSAMMLDRGRRLGARTYAFTPGSWKGASGRISFSARSWLLLTPEERFVLPRLRARDGRLIYRTDPLDAAGLGLHFLIPRIERQATFYDPRPRLPTSSKERKSYAHSSCSARRGGTHRRLQVPLLPVSTGCGSSPDLVSIADLASPPDIAHHDPCVDTESATRTATAAVLLSLQHAGRRHLFSRQAGGAGSFRPRREASTGRSPALAHPSPEAAHPLPRLAAPPPAHLP